LPSNEDFALEFVTDKPWDAYHWYKGNSFSIIQINTDLPISIDSAIGLASHEGYPGHHVHWTLLEKHLVRDRNWMEYSVWPLFNPRALIAEGTAEYAKIALFPGSERVEFERTVLFPLAGFDPSRAEKYYKIVNLTDELRRYGVKEAARRYLDGKMSKDKTIAWLRKYCLATHEQAEQGIRFFERDRSRIITYSVGRDIIKNYIGKHGGTDIVKRWELFYALLSTRPTASGLQ